MPPQYTLEQIDAELERRAKNQLGSGLPLGSGATGMAKAFSPLSTPSMATAQQIQQPGSPAVESPGAPPESPRRSMWDSVGDTASGMGRSLGTGVQEAVYGAPLAVNKLLGLHGFETTKRLFVDPLEQRLQAVREREAADTAGAGLGEQVARATARGVGNLVTLPVDIFMGNAVKAGAALAKGVEVAPKVATSAGEMLNAIPSFALGAGVRKTGEEESIVGLPKGIAEGLAMEKVGEIGKNMALAPKLATQAAAQGGLGAAMTTADTVASEGRLPTKEELAVAAGSNAAMALPFSAAPERMSVKRDMPPEFRKKFETTISDLINKDQISALPDENLSQLRDTAGKLAEYDPDNKTFMTGLLEIDREQQRRAGVEPQTMELGKPEETPPVAGPLPSRTELAGLAMGDLNSQDRLMEIADSYGIPEPHKMEPAALLDAIDGAETGRQAEAQRQTDAAQAAADMQAQADQARQDIVGATTEAGRLDAIKRFEDVTKKLAQAPALPAGQGFDLVPYEGRRDVQAGRAMLEEQRAALGEAPALPPGQVFELVGGPKPFSEAEARTLEAEASRANAAEAVAEVPAAKDMADFDAGRWTTEEDMTRAYEADALRESQAAYGNKPLSPLWDFLRGRLDAKSVSGRYGTAVLEDLRGKAPRDLFRSGKNGGMAWDKLEQEARSQGLLPADADMVETLLTNVPERSRVNAPAEDANARFVPEEPVGPNPEESGLQPINSDGTPTDGVFYDRAPKPQAPAEFARTYGIPETPEFLDAIKMYQDITGEGRQEAVTIQPPASDAAPLESRPADVQPVAPGAAPEPAQPALVAPVGKDGQPLFETITAAPFKPSGFADAALPQPARKLGQPDMVPLSSQSPNADMGGQGQAQGEVAAAVDGLTPLRVELPEMVRMTRDLIAKNPMVKERLSKAEARGLFRAKPDNPGIELASHIFIGPMLAEVRTKAPAAEARAALTDALAKAHGVPANEIQVKASKDGAWTKLRAFRSDPEHAGQVLAHEIGHLVDFLPDQTMARGNILGRLASLKKNIKTMIEDMPADAPDMGAVPAEGPRSGLIGNNEIRAELKALTQFWKPFNPAADPEYTRYRHSGSELYADAFSVLLNAPAELKARAPKFYDAFQNYLIQKPEVRETYQGIQNAMHSGQVFKDRVQATREGFAKADEMRGGMYADERTLKEKAGETGLWAKRAFVDQYAPVREVLTGEDASFAINRAIYSGSEKELYVTEMHQRVSQRLQDAGLTPDDLGEYLLHLRVINERGQMANPHGWTPKASLERLEEMRSSTYSPDQLAALEGAEKDFRDIRANLVTDKMDQSGMFAPELMQHIREATDYATFDVVKYIDGSYGTGIGSKIHKQIGTFEAVGSPYTATLKKDLSMLSSINWNNAKKTVVDDLLANRPDQITPAEMRFNGKSMSPVEKTTDKVGTIFMMRDGKVEGYHVDRLVAEAFNRERPEDLHILGRTLSAMSSPFRMIFTTIRPGFQAFNAIRDLRALYRNLPGDLTAGKTIRNYLKALPDAWAAEFGLTPEIVKEMQRDDMLISVADPMGLARIDQEHDRLMKMYNMEPGQYKNTVWKPFMNLYGQTLKMGGFLERIPKIAAYRYLKENFPEMSQDQIGEFVRTKAGSPAFLYKGSLSPITNNLFLFSNAIVQGMRGDFGAMKADPKNWWSKWAMGTMAPKMIGRMALYGAFGAGVKIVMNGISDYDLSNYDVIPLGLDANGKSVYLRLPVDEMGRMTGSLLWKGLNLVDGAGGPTRPADIFDMMAGQAPNVAPWASLIGGAVSFLSGHNPYDAFRGRKVIDPTVFNAGGWEAQKKMLEWMWNSAGLGIVHRFETREVDLVKTDLQKVIGLPVLNDFLGRFVKVSDLGIREKLRAAGDVESSKRAQQVLDARSALAKMINGEALTDADTVALARESKTLKQSYGRLLTKQQDEALASALQNAGSQLEKAAVYQEYDRIKGTRGAQ